MVDYNLEKKLKELFKNNEFGKCKIIVEANIFGDILITEYDAEFEDFYDKIWKLEEDVYRLEEDIEYLKSEISELDYENMRLDKELVARDKEIIELKKMVDEYK